MKEATGELNMTVITLVAVAAVGALFYFVIWPVIQRMVMNQTCGTYGSNWTAVKVDGENGTQFCSQNDNDKVECWACCPKDSNGGATFNNQTCIVAD